MITSASNTQVKNIIQLNQKAKARREQGLFVAEGRKMFGEAPRDWISKVYVMESLTSDSSLMEQISMLPEGKAEIVADHVFRQMCDTKTPQGILTVLRKPVWTIQDILRGDSPLQNRRRSRSIRSFSHKDMCGYHKSKSHSFHYGICLQNAFSICGGCGIIKSRTEAKRNPYLCCPSEREKFL